MTSDEIRQMFRFAGDLNRLPAGSPSREESENMLAILRKRYVAENVVPPGDAPAEKIPLWMEALQYVAALFAQMDSVDPAGKDQRKAYWREISANMSHPPTEPEAKEPELER